MHHLKTEEMLASHRPGLHELGETLEAAVVGALDLLRETAGRKLAHAEMIGEALAAHPLSRTSAVAAVAPFQIALLLAFHG